MTLYETIFVRRSVRKYDGTTLDTAALNEIKSYAGSAKQLAGQSARFEIADGDKLKGGIAPYALLAFADDTDAAFINIGYALQGVDLWLQSQGYGSVWCGMASPKEPLADYRILLGFGGSSVPLRSGESEFKRKKLADIANADNAVTRSARLAPSAVNFQPWKLGFTDSEVTVQTDVRGVGKVIPGKLYLFDLGIITKHVEVALEHEGKTVTAIEVNENGKNSSTKIKYAKS